MILCSLGEKWRHVFKRLTFNINFKAKLFFGNSHVISHSCLKSKKNKTVRLGHKYMQVTVSEMTVLILRQGYLHMNC